MYRLILVLLLCTAASAAADEPNCDVRLGLIDAVCLDESRPSNHSDAKTWDKSAAPQTADECRASTPQSEIVSCIGRGIYDPCDDAGGGFVKAQCAWAHLEIAQRRVNRAEREILDRLKRSRVPTTAPPFKLFQRSQRAWRVFRDDHCRFTNFLGTIEQLDVTSSFDLGFCQRRLTEQRAAELEEALGKSE